MPINISRGRFTADAVKGMLAKPENREEAVAKLFKSLGGKLIGWYLTFGQHDWMAIGEFPDEKAAAAAVLAAAAGGSLSDIETTVAMTAKTLQRPLALPERQRRTSAAPAAERLPRTQPERKERLAAAVLAAAAGGGLSDIETTIGLSPVEVGRIAGQNDNATGFQLPTIPDAFEGYFWR